MLVDVESLVLDILLRITAERDMPLEEISPSTSIWEDLGFTYSELMCMLCDMFPEYGLREDLILQISVDDIYDVTSVARAVEGLSRESSYGYGFASGLQSAYA